MTRRWIAVIQALLVSIGVAGLALLSWLYSAGGPLAEAPPESLAAWLIVLVMYSMVVCAVFPGDPHR